MKYLIIQNSSLITGDCPSAYHKYVYNYMYSSPIRRNILRNSLFYIHKVGNT